MDIVELITPDRVIGRFRADDKMQLLNAMARHASTALRIDAQSIVDALAAREALGSTGVGQGVAMPHARVPGLERTYCLFLQLERPIDFAAIDAEKVDLVFLLLTPANPGNDHLTALACASRQLRNRDIAANLRRAKDDTELYRALTGGGDLEHTRSAPGSRAGSHTPRGNQRDRFVEAARAAECSEDEAVFDETLKRIAKAKPQGKAVKEDR